MAEEMKDNLPVGTERLPLQIDEVNKRLRIIEDLITALSPGVEKIPEEIPSTIRDLRERFERDEKFPLLLKRFGDNIPTFISFMDIMVAMKGMIEDFAPEIQKIIHETRPTIRDLRERFERDETLILLKRFGDNIPTFISFMDIMVAMKGMIEDFAPEIQKIIHETRPTIRDLRERFERDETLDLLRKTGENINTLSKLLDFLGRFEKSGTLDFTLENIVAKETDVMIRGIQATASKTMLQFMEDPPKPGLKNIFKAIRDPEVQKGILFLTAFAKNLSQCMSDASTDLRK